MVEDDINELRNKLAIAREALEDVLAWFEQWSVEVGPAEQTLFDRINRSLSLTRGGTQCQKKP